MSRGSFNNENSLVVYLNSVCFAVRFEPLAVQFYGPDLVKSIFTVCETKKYKAGQCHS